MSRVCWTSRARRVLGRPMRQSWEGLMNFHSFIALAPWTVPRHASSSWCVIIKMSGEIKLFTSETRFYWLLSGLRRLPFIEWHLLTTRKELSKSLKYIPDCTPSLQDGFSEILTCLLEWSIQNLHQSTHIILHLDHPPFPWRGIAKNIINLDRKCYQSELSLGWRCMDLKFSYFWQKCM